MKELLIIARKSIEEGIDGKKYIAENDIKRKYSKKQASFVTLTIKGDLRGCIGSIYPVRTLWEDVRENAINAAFMDPRFLPLDKSEIKKIKIEVSVLTVPQKLEFEDYNDLLKKINNKMGLIIRKGYRSATYLPQVWEELVNKEEFLSSLCEKAGLDKEEWKKGIDVWIYYVEKVKEE